MTFPIGDPAVHNPALLAVDVAGEIAVETEFLIAEVRKLLNVIVLAIINAILSGLGLGAWIGPVDQGIHQLQVQVGNLIHNPIGTVEGDINSLIVGVGGASILDVAVAIEGSVNNFITLIRGVGGTTINDLLVLLQKIQQLIDALAQGLGALGTGHLVSEVQTLIQAIPGGNIQGVITHALQNAFHLIGHNPLNAIPFIPASHVVNANPQLLWNSGFDTAASVVANGAFTWDGSLGHTGLGTAKCTAKGLLCNMISSPIPVTIGETLNLSVWAYWTSLVSSGSNPPPIHMDALQYFQGSQVASTVIASVPSPGSSSNWTSLAGSFSVPGGVDTVYLSLNVDLTATSGFVWFDDASVYKQGTMGGGNTLQTAWGNLLQRLFGVASIEAKILGQALPDITRLLSSDLQGLIDQICNALGIPGVGHAVSDVLTALEHIPGTVITGLTSFDQNLLNSLAIAFNGITAFENGIQSAIQQDIVNVENTVLSWFHGGVGGVVGTSSGGGGGGLVGAITHVIRDFF